MAAMSPEAKSALMARLTAGRAKHKALRAADPTHKPRKSRKPKATTDTAEALSNPKAAPAANDTIPGIDSAPPGAVNTVAAAPVAPVAPKSTPIDVPNLPEAKKLKKIVKKPTEAPVPKESKGLSTTGKPSRINANNLIVNEETGAQVISSMLPGQKESIAKVLRKNKKLDPIAPASNPEPLSRTVDARTEHVPDLKAVEARAPFSFSAVRKVLWQ